MRLLAREATRLERALAFALSVSVGISYVFYCERSDVLSAMEESSAAAHAFLSSPVRDGVRIGDMIKPQTLTLVGVDSGDFVACAVIPAWAVQKEIPRERASH